AYSNHPAPTPLSTLSLHDALPICSSLVKSLTRPRGNATGFLVFEYSIASKWFELLKEITPRVSRVAVLRDATLSAGIGQFAAVRSEEHTSELQSRENLVCRLLLEK